MNSIEYHATARGHCEVAQKQGLIFAYYIKGFPNWIPKCVAKDTIQLYFGPGDFFPSPQSQKIKLASQSTCAEREISFGVKCKSMRCPLSLSEL